MPTALVNRELSLEKAIKLLQECIAERGGSFVYSGPADVCWNWHDEGNQPGCIIGMAMFKFTGDRDTIRAYSPSDAYDLLDALEVKASRMTRVFLRDVQSAQDTKSTWQDALLTGLGKLASS